MEEYLWVEKYRPHKIEDVILPKHYKEQFQAMADKGEIPNLLLSGTHGIGKTSVAKALADEIGATVMFINASLDGGKETLRSDIKDFAGTMTFDGSRKVVILDEADNMTHAMQPALRTFMEQYSKNVSFILTCNFPHNIIEPLRSRCSHIEFKFSKDDKVMMAKQMFVAIKNILEKEEVEYDKEVIAQLVKKKFPDMRSMINTLHQYSITRKSIDVGILTSFDANVKALVKAMKDKSFDGIRNWVVDSDIDQHEVYGFLFDNCKVLIEDADSQANLILTLADYQDKATRAVNQDINLTAALVEIAANVVWKG